MDPEIPIEVEIEEPIEQEPRNILYRHKTTRQFIFGEWHFKDFELRLSESEEKRFLAEVKDPRFPRSELIHIVKVNEAALASVETGVDMGGVKVIRGAAGADAILTAEDQARLKQMQRGLGTNPTGAKPLFPTKA